MSDQAGAGGTFRHAAWMYRSGAEYAAGVREFIAAGESASEPVLVAAPAGQLPPGWQVPDGKTGAVRVLDDTELGRNPARMMPVLRAFADEHRGSRVRVLADLAWTDRSPPELGEVARFERTLNLAFAGSAIRILCPYNADELPASAVAAARSSHPWLCESGQEFDSGDFDAAAASESRRGLPLWVPPGARALSYRNDLRPVRALVATEAARAGLSGPRGTDLVIAASEVAANTLKHTGNGGMVRVWVTPDEVLCQFDDSGHIANPLAGYGRPARDVPGGQGLWLVNQVCDLAEIRTSAGGTTVRLHMFRDDQRASLAGRAQPTHA